MKILKEYPPNIEAIRKVFPLTGNEIFAWGDIIYSPSSATLPVWLIDHEKIHAIQQLTDNGKFDPESWWARYLVDTKFRFEQELEAHQTEYTSFCNEEPNRNKRRAYLKGMSRRLSSPMYGRIVTFKRAHNLIKGKKA